MNPLPENDRPNERRVRICRPAFQDMHLLIPRQAARAQLRRNALKLRFWKLGDASVADLGYRQIDDGFHVATVSEGFGLAEGFRIVFCEVLNPEPHGTVWVLSVMRTDECFSTTVFEILQARRAIARERSGVVRWWQG